MRCFFDGTAGRLASLPDTLAEQPAPDQAPDRSKIILTIEHHTHVLLMRTPVKQLQDYADLCYSMSMCLHEQPKPWQIDSFTRRYYEKELGAGVGPNPSMKEFFGYTEPFRRFVQNETFSPQANEIPNPAASWLPGDDYYTNVDEVSPGGIKLKEYPGRLFQFSSVSTSAADMSARILGEH